MATDYNHLKLVGPEDDNDDEDDEVAQNKLLILAAKDVKTGTSVATCLREKGVSEYATSWMVPLLRRLGYRQAILKSDGEPSIAILKLRLWWQLHQSNWFCEKAQLVDVPPMVLLSLPCAK